MIWPPDYTEILKDRQDRFVKIKANPILQAGSKEYYKDRPDDFINDWLVTYDPRNVGKGIPAVMPFSLFDRQRDLIKFIVDCLFSGENGLIEKGRDMGATWVCAAVSEWIWLFHEGSSVGWGSRKEQLVDKLGDPDSIFEKIRMLIHYTPSWFLPKGFDPNKNTSYMKIINPEIGSSITGEAGDNIGRGGRKLIYFKDESSYYEHPEKIEAALGDNTEVQIDISSVNGTGNVFYRKRKSGVIWEPGKEIEKGRTRVFLLDWRDHPAKTQGWYDKRREQAAREGLGHIFAQEVDRDYTAAVQGVTIPAVWVKSAIDAHIKLGFDDSGLSISALDVADGGADKNAHANRKGVILKHVESWSDLVEDVGQTTLKTVSDAQALGASELHYDCIGVGSGVKSESNRLIREDVLGKDALKILAWNAAASPLNPDEHINPANMDTPLNKDFYKNLKAQGWWMLRRRFEKTFNFVTKNIESPFDELISIPSDLPNVHDIIDQLSQPTYKHDGSKKLIINKSPDGTKSPNEADAVMMCYWPVKTQEIFIA
jgi:phage terminase large subunit